RVCRSFDFEHGQWINAVAAERNASLFANNYQTKPWPQSVSGVCFRGSEEPGKVWTIEFDSREVVWLEIGGQVSGHCSQHLSCVYADDVARTIKPHLLLNLISGGVIHLQFNLHGNEAGLIRALVNRLDIASSALPYPRKKNIICRRTSHGLPHPVSVAGQV